MSSAKTAFVTGASRGIGAAIAKEMASAGFRVAVGYQSRQQDADAVAADIAANGGEACVVRLNVAERESIRSAVTDATQALGPIDVLVNNAAIAQEKPFLTITDEDWDAMMGANLRGPFALTQEVLPGMIERKWGRIVNITSIGGQWGGINQIHYASSKAALIGFTRSIGKTFSADGVTCNAIAPGLVATEMAAAELETEAGKEKVKNIPAGRLGLAEEVGAAVCYLAGPDGGYITGQTLNLNGGMYFG